MRNIYAQGDFDGACFLYSIVNAYVALQGRSPEFGAVCAAFGLVDHPGDFLNGCVGTTGAYDKDYGLLAANISRVLAALGGGPFAVRRVPGPFAESALAELLSERSVVLLRYMGSSRHAAGMDHWVCAVDYDAERGEAHVACSVRFNHACDDPACAYAETRCPRFGRWANDILSAADAHTIVEGEVFVISMPA
ncbi:hypothetical protein [Humidesulfovibrio idahonensis]